MGNSDAELFRKLTNTIKYSEGFEAGCRSTTRTIIDYLKAVAEEGEGEDAKEVLLDVIEAIEENERKYDPDYGKEEGAEETIWEDTEEITKLERPIEGLVHGTKFKFYGVPSKDSKDE